MAPVKRLAGWFARRRFFGIGGGTDLAAGLLGEVDGLLHRAAMWSPLLWTSAAARRIHRTVPSQPDD